MDKHIEKIMFKSSYKLNEDASFKRIDSKIFEEDDDVNSFINNEINVIGEDEEIEQEEAIEKIPDVDDEEIELEDSENLDTKTNSIDKLQTDIIKTNISTMKMIHDKLKNLENNFVDLSSKFDNLQKDVDEVKEPSNEEKLENKKYDSYPFYKNLNDIWNSDKYNRVIKDEGIIKLNDGTYIASFDDLGDLSNGNLEKSYYVYEEKINRNI